MWHLQELLRDGKSLLQFVIRVQCVSTIGQEGSSSFPLLGAPKT